MKNRQGGFTLIELIIVVAIVAVLAMIAYPSYRNHVVHATRNQAEATLLKLSQMEERYYTNNYQYYPMTTAAPTAEPQGWDNFSGDSMGTRKYDIGISINSTQNTFTITATPSNGFQDTQCGALTLDNIGNKGSATNDPGCWK